MSEPFSDSSLQESDSGKPGSQGPGHLSRPQTSACRRWPWISRASTSPGPEFSPPSREARAWLPAQLCRQHQPEILQPGGAFPVGPCRLSVLSDYSLTEITAFSDILLGNFRHTAKAAECSGTQPAVSHHRDSCCHVQGLCGPIFPWSVYSFE